MTVEKILTRRKAAVYSIHPDRPVAEAAEMMCAKRIGSLLVFDEEHALQGILTERDILRSVAAGKVHNTLVKDIMTPKEKLIVSNKDNDLRYVMSLMMENDIRHIPIVEHDRIIALVSMRDVVNTLFKEYEKHLPPSDTAE